MGVEIGNQFCSVINYVNNLRQVTAITSKSWYYGY